ncbi:putative serine/threonine-protein kinase dyrk2 [Ananas comosus]|uniref:Putative serine/threonine-protein kinase dyrk2 n=1 Tax=Ananas comosus TaxID=4615 RepID=A0A199UFQ4_ANACO|nr:putative serine/threonine-protein kinase dyrk2 [Ananas comosus]
MIGSFLDGLLGKRSAPQKPTTLIAGGKRTIGNSWLSVSQGIAEDSSDLVSGFATVGDESLDYPNDYWDSDEYDDDDDVGYTRQPIEDEAWFLAHEIDYPSDNEKGNGGPGPGSALDQPDRPPMKDDDDDDDDDDDHSFAEEEEEEEDSCLSGEQYFQAKNIDRVASSKGLMGLRTSENDLIAQYDGELMDAEELKLMRGEPVWRGFVTQNNELVMLGNGKARPDETFVEDDHHGSVRSIGVGISSDAADIGSEVRESLVGGSSEGDLEYFHDHDVGIIAKRNSSDNMKGIKPDHRNNTMAFEKAVFSFPSPISTEDVMEASSGRPIRSNRGSTVIDDDSIEYDNGLKIGDEKSSDIIRSRDSTASSASNYSYALTGDINKLNDHEVNNQQEEDPASTLEDEELAALQEQVRQIQAQEEEFETFELKIVHRKNRTGFEEDKNFHVMPNSVIAGRYHVTEYLGSAAFSKAIQAHDLHTGVDVCIKIIKNNKDFFDQSLDEIKLLKYVNKHDPGDKYHILRLYDYFYYREHLLIVCELLKANLYEFHKFNRESGGEVYFTMPRLQSITIQCLEALQFLHGLGLIHCDLKPENILVKSYSRCEVKVIDLGSSCFETDHLCSYVQSRSYRAPEVILGLPYDKKIDIWSLGCILAELCTGNVLFQNDSPATLLARVIGIIGPIEQGMLAEGRDTYKCFTKNHILYERNQETNRLEYLMPKKTSLQHRLPMGDQGFIDFVAYLLEINPKKRPSASEALKHPWLSYPYEPISS